MSPDPAAAVPPSRRRPPAPVRVVFFGPPYSGKSALLQTFGDIASAGAEDEAEELPIDLLPADIRGRSVIRRKVKVDLPDAVAIASAVTLIDCDGAAAGELLRDTTALTRPRVRNELLDSIRSADALVVTVDATDTPDKIRRQVEDLRLFLKAFREGRSFGREVGGLPVFLTLTKCDRLYAAGMSPDEWATAIEGRVGEVKGKFDEVLGERAVGPFGEISLAVLATAAVVPTMPPFRYYADSKGRLHGDELVRDVLAAAADYGARRRQARKRLGWTVSAALGLLGVMIAALLALALAGEPGPVELLTLRALQVREREGPPEVRLADRNFARNRERLADLRAAPYFAELPPDVKKWAADRDREFTAYAEYRARFYPPQFSPAEVRTANELTTVTGDLTTTLLPPPEYATEWAKTEAVRLRDKWAADRDLLVKAEDVTHNWYRNLVTRATTLMSVEVPDAAWRERVSALFADSGSPPVQPADPIPGSPVVSVRRGEPLTYAAAYQFERTDIARQDWEYVGRKLGDLRDLTDALGLTVDPVAPAAPLDLPEPSGDPAASLALGADRWRSVRDRFPRVVDGTANWAASHYPDPVRQELLRRARTAAETALRHVRRLIASEVKNRPDAPADWPKLADGLLATPAMQDWSRLVQLLLKCADIDRPTAALPVTDLAAFVAKTSFVWSPTAVEIFLPTALLTDAYAPDGSFAITVTPDRGAPRVTAFGPAKVAERTPRGVRYRFPLERGTAPLVYRPGEGLTAELPVKSGAATYKLKWAAGGTATYQFDRLTREPVLEPTAGGVAFPATGAKLDWTPAKEVVTVPELLPDVK